MPETLSFSELVERILQAAGGRIVVAVAGPPGAGKSTFADRLAARLTDAGLPAAVLPMDGFHYDDIVLEVRGDRARKGAPHTFDVDGLVHTLRRLSADDGRAVAVPVFDRSIEIARAGARIIGSETRAIIVEGNYLLLDAPGWDALAGAFDLTVMLEVDEAELRRRLSARWAALDTDSFAAKMEGNDLPNARLVVERSRPADVIVRSEGGYGDGVR